MRRLPPDRCWADAPRVPPRRRAEGRGCCLSYGDGCYASILVRYDWQGYGDQYCERDWYYGSDPTVRSAEGYFTVDNTA